MVYYLFFNVRVTIYNYTSASLAIGSPRPDLEGKQDGPQEWNEKILSTHQLASCSKKKIIFRTDWNQRLIRLLFILKETTCFRRGFDFDALFYVCTCRPCIKRYHEFFFLFLKNYFIPIGEIVCHKFKGAVGYWYPLLLKPGHGLDFPFSVQFVKKFHFCGSVDIAFHSNGYETIKLYNFELIFFQFNPLINSKFRIRNNNITNPDPYLLGHLITDRIHRIRIHNSGKFFTWKGGGIMMTARFHLRVFHASLLFSASAQFEPSAERIR